MKTDPAANPSVEIELKLALPGKHMGLNSAAAVLTSTTGDVIFNSTVSGGANLTVTPTGSITATGSFVALGGSTITCITGEVAL